MNNGIGDVVNGALYQQMRLSVLANNLSNINTVGFKKDNIVYQPDANADAIDPNNLPATISYESEEFAGIVPASTYIDFTQGQLISTGNKLDVGLNGDGFFCIETLNGEQYTRKGNFTINEQNELCTQEGHPVLGEGGKIVIQSQDLQIDETGNIFVDGNTIDTLKILNFPQASLMKQGNGLFKPMNQSITGEPVENMTVQQGYIERSNVNAVKMMTEMIDTLRGFESYQKAMQFINETTLEAINDVGQVF